MEFAKLHGLGNDFLVARTPEVGARPRLAELAVRMCDRRRGIGADGILFYQPAIGDGDSDVATLIFNADGSKAEMSGNGTRCLAAFLHFDRICEPPAVRIRTVSGLKRYLLKSREKGLFIYESAIGCPIFEPSLIPVRIEHTSTPIVGFPLRVGESRVQVTVSSMGNPHCTTFWGDLDRAPLESLGPVLENHAVFPNRTNVEFVQVLDRHRLRAAFWERGVGRTPASGTGCAASAVAAMLNGYAESPVTVESELGEMQVRWQEPEELYLTGSAEYICRGNYTLGSERRPEAE